MELVSLVYTLNAGARGMSQFVTAHPDLDTIINNAPLDTRAFIERILHTVRYVFPHLDRLSHQ